MTVFTLAEPRGALTLAGRREYNVWIREVSTKKTHLYSFRCRNHTDFRESDMKSQGAAKKWECGRASHSLFPGITRQVHYCEEWRAFCGRYARTRKSDGPMPTGNQNFIRVLVGARISRSLQCSNTNISSVHAESSIEIERVWEWQWKRACIKGIRLMWDEFKRRSVHHSFGRVEKWVTSMIHGWLCVYFFV